MNMFAEASNNVSDPVLIATIAFFGTLIAGLFKIIQNQTKANEHLAKGIERLAHNSDKNAHAQAEVAKELKRGNAEAEKRNGHLGEQTEQIAIAVAGIGDNMTTLADRNLKVYKEIESQHVKHQIVDHETIKEKES